MPLLQELLHVLGGGAAGAGLEQPTAVHQRHDGQHPGTRPQFQNREQIGQIVTQDVAGCGNRVFAPADPFQRKPHPVLGLHDPHVQAGRIVLGQVGVQLLDDFRIVASTLVEPEDHRCAARPGPGDGQAHPVPDRRVLGLAHAEDIADLDRLFEQRRPGAVHHPNPSVGRGFEGFVVRAVLLGLLGHQPDVGDAAHGRRVELTVFFGVFQDLLIHGCVGAVGHHGDHVLQLVVLIPHPAPVAHHIRHGGVNDDVVGHVQVGDAAPGVDHGQGRACVVHRRNVSLDLGFFLGRQAVELGQHVGQPVVDVGPDLFENLGVLVERLLEVDRHAVAEHDGVRDLHHRRLEVQGQQHAVLLCRVHLLGVERA